MPKPIPLQYGCFYHIYNRGNNREVLFRSDENCRFFFKRYLHHIAPIADTYAYCLMSNHFHLLVYILTEDEQSKRAHGTAVPPPNWKPKPPSKAFSNLFASYTMGFNKMWGRTGSLFQKRFGRKRITNDAYFSHLVRYIHHNPQKHRFVDDFRDWKWSSYSAFLRDGESHVSRAACLQWFSDSRTTFANDHTIEPDEKLIAPIIMDDWV